MVLGSLMTSWKFLWKSSGNNGQTHCDRFECTDRYVVFFQSEEVKCKYVHSYGLPHPNAGNFQMLGHTHPSENKALGNATLW